MTCSDYLQISQGLGILTLAWVSPLWLSVESQVILIMLILVHMNIELMYHCILWFWFYCFSFSHQQFHPVLSKITFVSVPSELNCTLTFHIIFSSSDCNALCLSFIARSLHSYIQLSATWVTPAKFPVQISLWAYPWSQCNLVLFFCFFPKTSPLPVLASWPF